MAVGNDDCSVLRHCEPLPVFDQIMADELPRRDFYALVDNAVPKPGPGTDTDIFKQDRFLHSGVVLETDTGKQDRVTDLATRNDNTSQCGYAASIQRCTVSCQVHPASPQARLPAPPPGADFHA